MNEKSKTPADPEKRQQYAIIGLVLALVGLSQVVFWGIVGMLMLFFGALIMCGATLWVTPFSLGAIILGWMGRNENPKVAWSAIIIGLLIVPLSLALFWLYGTLLYEATASL